MERAFQSALSVHAPDAALVLGDATDEGKVPPPTHIRPQLYYSPKRLCVRVRVRVSCVVCRVS